MSGLGVNGEGEGHTLSVNVSSLHAECEYNRYKCTRVAPLALPPADEEGEDVVGEPGETLDPSGELEGGDDSHIEPDEDPSPRKVPIMWVHHVGADRYVGVYMVFVTIHIV